MNLQFIRKGLAQVLMGLGIIFCAVAVKLDETVHLSIMEEKET